MGKGEGRREFAALVEDIGGYGRDVGYMSVVRIGMELCKMIPSI